MQLARTDESVIGLRLKKARKEMYYTQKYLAQKLGISVYQLQKYENGSNRISIYSLCMAAILCKKPVEWFLQDLLIYDKSQENFADNPINKILHKFSYIKSKTVRIKLAELIEALAEKY